MIVTPERIRLAEAYLDAGEALHAHDMLVEHRDELAGTSAGLMLMARVYYHTAQLGRAETTLRELVEREPADHYARFLLGRTLERAHRAGEALPHYRVAAAMSADPEYRERLDTVSARLAA
ncbi:MAG: hypothetical protein AB7J32_00225 [Pseudonocardia sp.]